MIYSGINEEFTATLDGAPSGDEAELTVEVYDPVTDVLLIEPTNEGIDEDADEEGRYTVALTVAVANTLGTPFELRWRDDGEIAAVEDLVVGHGVTPYLSEVAALERSRTAVMGTVRGTFDEDTNPTADQVGELIVMAVGDVRARVGAPIPLLLEDEARRLAALQTASLIESSYFPNELDTDRSAHRTYSAMYLAGVEALKAAIPRAVRLV